MINNNYLNNIKFNGYNKKNPKKDNYYDIIASSYEELYGEEQLKKINRVFFELDNIIKNNNIKNSLFFKKLLNKSLKVIDIGSGTGFYFPFLRERFGFIKGLEPSKGLVNLSKEKNNIIIGFAEEMPFLNKEFDLALSFTAIQNFYDIKKGLLEIKRVASYFILSFLKKSNKRDFIIKTIKEVFSEKKLFFIEEENDMIFFINLI